MNILTIPLRNSRRKWLRTFLLLTVFSLAVMSIVCLNYVSQVVGENLEKKLTAYGANILVYPKSESLSVSYGGFSMGELIYDVKYLDESEVSGAIRGIELDERLSAVAPKLVAAGRVGGSPVGVVGVDWPQERMIKRFWSVNGAFPKANNEIVAGSAAAAKLGLQPGSTIDLSGREAVVSGVLKETGGEDDDVLLAGLGFTQAAFGLPGKINFVEVSALCAGCPIEEIVGQISASLPGLEIKALSSVVESRMFSVKFVQKLILTVSLIILLTACTMVGVFMLSSVNERKIEVGILRSLGYSRFSVFAIFCFESLILGVAAGLAGYLAGFALSTQVMSLLDFVEDVSLAFRPMHLVATCLAMAAVSGLSAAAPAFKASKVEPSETLAAL
jgi:putative ABC transport system permease protein